MKVLKTINLPSFGKKYQGKVRDYYLVNRKRILVTTDRISSFDRVLGVIPHKGQVLNQLSAFWFKKTKNVVANHMINMPDPNVMVCKNCRAYPIEIVVRGYITGVTGTSLWYNYSQGKRKIYDLSFPDGLRKNQKLPEPIITPTTKGIEPGGHDEKISKKEIFQRKIISKKVYLQMEKAALALFKKGTMVCKKAGLILVDTKYEFGDYNGQLTLIDEVHTPDSSRFWITDSYQERIKKGLEPENFDKEFFRLWYAKRGYRGDGKVPVMSDYYRQKVSQRYRQLYEKIVGEKFKPEGGDIAKRIKTNLSFFSDKVIIIAGSQKDKNFVQKIEQLLLKKKLKFKSFYASAHKQPKEVLAVIERYEKTVQKIIFITIAGRSNALSGFVAANSSFPVIACPPFKDKLDYLVNIHSTLQMPSKVPVMTVLDPENAVLAVERILRQ